jgi:hypothetical protein
LDFFRKRSSDKVHWYSGYLIQFIFPLFTIYGHSGYMTLKCEFRFMLQTLMSVTTNQIAVKRNTIPVLYILILHVVPFITSIELFVKN